MQFKITIGNKTEEMSLEKLPTSSPMVEEYEVKSGSKQKKIVILKRDPDRIIVSVNDRAYSVLQLRRSSSEVEFIANGKTVKARLELASSGAPGSSAFAASTNELVASNFPAKIVKINVKAGDKLKEGDTMIILEAMKMEAQIRCPAPGLVVEIFVKEGQIVERGKALVRLRFEKL